MLTPTPSHPLLDALWPRYAAPVPATQTFAELYRQRTGRAFENDHIALRSASRAGGIAMFEAVFASLGWKAQQSYWFEDVHLRAIYMSQSGLPRIFISELIEERCSANLQDALSTHLDVVPQSSNVDFFARSRVRPTAAVVRSVAEESQYAAWLLLFHRQVNHFTARVDDVAFWQNHLRENGVAMKSDIEGAPLAVGEAGLRQTATQAAVVNVDVADGTLRWPYAYFEIAQRQGGFDGFLTAQARQLFDMTQRS
jgi:hypothetical protein